MHQEGLGIGDAGPEQGGCKDLHINNNGPRNTGIPSAESGSGELTNVQTVQSKSGKQ